MTYATKLLAAAALILAGGLAAHAQSVSQTLSAPAPGQEPPPVADKGTTAQYNCLDEDEKHVGSGKQSFYRITLTNKCEQRLKCAVFAYQVGSKGPSQGHGTLVLAPASKGAAAKKQWSMLVKMAGGSAQSARECGAM